MAAQSSQTEHLQPSIAMHGRRLQILCVPDTSPVQVGLARPQSLAETLDGKSATSTLMIWRCEPALLVTGPDTRLPDFENAAVKMKAIGWPVFLRKSGGGACPVGPGTMQVSMIGAAFPAATMKEKYTALAQLIQSALRAFQIESQIESVPSAYCPGGYDLAVDGKKIAGMSQHWFRNRIGIRCIATSASVNIEEPPDIIAAVVNRFYCYSGSTQRSQAAAITNLRLCLRADHLPDKCLPSAFMNELSLCADTLSRSPQQVLHRTQRASP